MYDYNNGRFLSVDPFIQNPTSTQSMNPYTYIFNNPLSGVDPTGYLSGLLNEVFNGDSDVVQPSLAEIGNNIETAITTSKVVVVGTVVVNIAIKVDEVTDYINPLKALAKKGLKATVKYAIKNGKEIAGKVKKGFKNISDILKPSSKKSKISSDQDMIDNLVNKRKTTNASNDATFAQGRDGDGNLTPVRESDRIKKTDGGLHAEDKVMKDLEGARNPKTVAVDQRPCPSCSSKLNNKNVDKVIVPSKASNPKGSPKTAAAGAAKKGTKVTPRIIKKEDL